VISAASVLVLFSGGSSRPLRGSLIGTNATPKTPCTDGSGDSARWWGVASIDCTLTSELGMCT
jgi:hypothetical protein